MIDSLETAIKHCEEVAEKQRSKAHVYENMMVFNQTIKHNSEAEYYEELMNECIECVEEYHQFAKWLKELKRWKEFGRNNAQFINDCLIQNQIDELYSSEIKNDADILRIDNEVLMLRTTNELCKSFNERYERWEREQNDE